MEAMFSCIGYHICTFQKGDVAVFEEEDIKHIGILLSGAVDMVKEDRALHPFILGQIFKYFLYKETEGQDLSACPSVLFTRDHLFFVLAQEMFLAGTVE